MKNIDTLWLYLEPFTFISEDAECFFLYNTNAQKGMSFRKSINLVRIIQELQDPVKLYSTRINVKDLENSDLYDFINNIQLFGFGDIVEGNLFKPLIMPPFLNIQNSVERLKQHNAPISDKILSYLHEVAIYIHGTCPQTCKGCENEFKQYLCCTKSDQLLEFTSIKNFLNSIKFTRASVSILGGDLFQYSKLSDILNMLKEIDAVHSVVTNFRNIPENSELLNVLSHKLLRLKVLVNGAYEVDDIFALAMQINKKNISQLWEISVTSISEYNKAESLYNKLASINVDLAIMPYYTGQNLQFFEDNVFLDYDELDDLKLDRQGVFALQALNTNNFGKITILSDGKIYANVNRKSIGHINDVIAEVLCQELEDGTSWRSTRYNKLPCKQCRFKLICPSSTNYELVIGKPNLCHIKE